MMGGMMGGFGGFGWLIVLGFWVLVIAVAVALVAAFFPRRDGGLEGRGHRADQGPADALAIAERRLAGGEITVEEFEVIRRTLAGSSAG